MQQYFINLRQPFFMKSFGQYSIRKENDTTYVDYKQTFNDWFTFSYTFIIGAGLSAFIVIMILHFDFSHWVFWAIGALVLAAAVYCFALAYAFLFAPTRATLTIDKLQRRLIVKSTVFKATTYELSDITALRLSGKNITKHLGNTNDNTTYQSIFMELGIVTKDDKTTTILVINSASPVSLSDAQTKASERRVAVPLTKFIAAEIGVPFHDEGFAYSYQ